MSGLLMFLLVVFVHLSVKYQKGFFNLLARRSRSNLFVYQLQFFGHRPLRRTLVLPVRYSSMLRPYGALSILHYLFTGIWLLRSLDTFSFLIPYSLFFILYSSSFSTTGDFTNSFKPSGSTALISSLGLL